VHLDSWRGGGLFHAVTLAVSRGGADFLFLGFDGYNDQ
jgi:hypothetical protein